MSNRIFMSSGDLVADRRYGFARDLQSRGDLTAAADLIVQAIERAPGFASAWFALGEIKQKLNHHDEAIVAFRRAAACDPQDRHGARLRLMRLGAEEVSAMSQGYVRTLFDQYAPRFEASLVGDLSYRGPDLLLEAVLAACRAMSRPALFTHAIDLGCGTGLAARAFAAIVNRIDGVDLSPRMIALAQATGLYAELRVADMIEGLAACDDASVDLILAADAAVYLADLAPLLRESARALASGGLLAFTTETHAGDGVVLGAGLRYAHNAGYVRDAVEAAGLMLSRLDDMPARNEDGAPVPGLVVVAARR